MKLLLVFMICFTRFNENLASIRNKDDEKFTTYNILWAVELANKLPVFVPPVNTHAPVVFAAFNNPFRISYIKTKQTTSVNEMDREQKRERASMREESRQRNRMYNKEMENAECRVRREIKNALSCELTSVAKEDGVLELNKTKQSKAVAVHLKAHCTE